MSCEWNEIYKEFKDLFPELYRRGTTYTPCGYMMIEIRIPSVGKFTYDYSDGQLTCLEEWMDEREATRRDKDMRPGMYESFCRAVEDYIYKHDLTQQQFADLVGISSRSITKYLTKVSMPKVSTMRRICETINIDLNERD